MIETGEIWCLAGLPGAGKTTLGKKLAATPGCFHIEADEEIARISRNAIQENASKPRTQAEIASRILKLRESFAAVLEFSEMENHPDDSDLLQLLQMIKSFNMNDRGFDEIVTEVFHGASFPSKFFALLGRRSTLEKGAQAARDGKIVLLDCPEFMGQRDRLFTRRYLSERHNLEPGIIILQVQQETLLARAREREIHEGNSLSRNPQALREMMKDADPYGPGEGFKRVLVLGHEIASRIEEVRILIARAKEHQISTKPVPLFI